MDRVKRVDESLSRERTSSSGEPDSSPEIVLGDISATARLDLGSERVRLFATNTRLIVTHIGKTFCGDGSLSVSIGQAFHPADGSNAEELLSSADRRMYSEKQSHHAMLAARIAAAGS